MFEGIDGCGHEGVPYQAKLNLMVEAGLQDETGKMTLMKILSDKLPVATTLLAAMLTAGCSSGASVGNYLWGDDTAPATPPSAQATIAAPGQAGQAGGLPAAPDTSTYSYTPSSASPGASGFSKLPKNSQRVFVVVNDQPITGYD
ncbi:MAG TPA: hypothetical protein EYP31_07890, partial [Roseibacterium sp.]|nr:hypothetical protein [Roseibacterium sp.]